MNQFKKAINPNETLNSEQLIQLNMQSWNSCKIEIKWKSVIEIVFNLYFWTLPWKSNDNQNVNVLKSLDNMDFIKAHFNIFLEIQGYSYRRWCMSSTFWIYTNYRKQKNQRSQKYKIIHQ